MRDELKEIKDLLEEIKGGKVDQSLFSTTTRLDNEAPIWNASHIANMPVDTKHKKDGWGFLINKGKLDLFPIGESRFYDHNELTNYKKEEHTPLNDEGISVSNVWSSKKTASVIDESRKKANITLNKELARLKEEIREIVDKSPTGKLKTEATQLLKRVEKAESDIDSIRTVVGGLINSEGDKVTYTVLGQEIDRIQKQMAGVIELKLGKVQDKTFTKTELNKKFRELQKELTSLTKVSSKKGIDGVIKDLQLNKADWGHEHMAKEIKYNGQRLNEYLDTLVTGGDSLPDQTGNSGKFLTTDGSDPSWASIPGGGDMLASVYDPQEIVADAFDVDNHTDGTTNKVYTATEQTKLTGIEASADVTDAGNVGSSIHGAAGKTTPVDADTVPLIDSAASNVLKKVSWSNIKATLKSYFDSLYQVTGNYFDKTSDDLDDITAGSTNKHFTSTLNSKLDGIEAGAEVNDVDSVNGQTGTVSLDIDDVAPDQTGNSGKVLKTNGTTATWQDDATGAGGVADGDKGDITVSDDGDVWTIDADVVSNSKAANMAEATVKGRAASAGTGDPTDLSASQVRTIINVEDGADVTDSTNVDAAGAVMNSDYDANTILAATSDNTPAALTVGTQTVVGRAGGNIAALSIDSDLSSVSGSDDTIPSAKATKAALDLKAPIASPTFTGTVTLPTGLTGVIRTDSGVVSVDSDVTDIVAAATTSAAGKVELATTAETETGTDTARAVTPDGLHDMTTLAGAAWFLDEDDMSSDSAVKTASQQSIKAYIGTAPKGLSGLNDIRSKAFFLPSPAATDDIPIVRFDTAITLTKVVYALGGTTNWVGQVQEADDAQGTSGADTQASDSTVTGTTSVTSFSNASLDAGDYLRLKTTSVSGTPDWLHVTIYYTIN